MFSTRAEQLGVEAGEWVDAVFYPQINEFHGRRSVQLLMVDVRRADTERECENILDSGALPGAWECEELYPNRRDFVHVWRWLTARGGAVSGRLDELEAWGPAGMSPAKTAVCLRAMSEEGIARLDCAPGELKVYICEREGKANLEASPVMTELRRRCEPVSYTHLDEAPRAPSTFLLKNQIRSLPASDLRGGAREQAQFTAARSSDIFV